MSQSEQQAHGAGTAKPRARKNLELFWRIIAVLMLLIIAWILWVLYQITPRSVATPLAYATQINPIRMQAPTAGAAGTIAFPQSTPTAAAEPHASPEAAAAALAIDRAQSGARSGAHQAAADIQAAALEAERERTQRAEPLERDGLKLSSEITTPLVGNKRVPKK